MELLPNVLSFNPARLKVVNLNKHRMAVEKLTHTEEYQQMISAHKHLTEYPISLKNQTISFMPAPVLDWQSKRSVLVTEYCKGINLESALRLSSKRERLQWIKLFKKLFQEMRLKGFLWGDCAPRNMIFNENLGCIRIVDFERKLILKNHPVNPNVFSRYIKSYAKEEFSCFLLKDEQGILFADIVAEDQKEIIPISKINSKRKKELLNMMFGVKDSYNIKEIHEAEELMIFIATPFIVGGSIFYPMDLIDKISNKGGPNVYIRIAQKLRQLNSAERHNELQEIAKVFQ